ncbi:MAG: SpoIIE family protein phosphatase [Bacillota bacterium]
MLKNIFWIGKISSKKKQLVKEINNIEPYRIILLEQLDIGKIINKNSSVILVDESKKLINQLEILEKFKCIYIFIIKKNNNGLDSSLNNFLLKENFNLLYDGFDFNDLFKYLNSKNLKNNELGLNRLLNKLQQMVLITNKNHKIIYANKKLLKHTGYKMDELEFKDVTIFRSNRHNRIFYNNIKHTLLSNLTWEGKFYNKKKDGSYYWEKAYIFCYNLEGEKVYIKISEDISHYQMNLNKKESNLKLASSIQSSLLPQDLYDKDIIIKGYYRPFKNISGDIYFWNEYVKGVYRIFLIDVVGHGTGSALITTSVITFLNELLNEKYSLEKMLNKLNQKIINLYNLKDFEQSTYFTMLSLEINTNDKSIKYSNCGHPFFYLMHNNSINKYIERNFPIGLINTANYTSKTISYDKNDKILLFTDGLIEIDFDLKSSVSKLDKILENFVEDRSNRILKVIDKDMIKPNYHLINDDISMLSISL